MQKKRKKILSVREKVVFLQSRLRWKKRGWGRVEIIEETETEGSVPEPNSPKGGAVRAENEKGRKDNSEEILTMKSLILAQDER